MAILIFIFAAALIALASMYIFYKKDTSIMNYALAGLGVLLAALGITSIALLLIKIKNTKEVEKNQEIQRMKEAEAARENQNVETKIIDISELRKRNGKKVYTKEIALTDGDNNDDETNGDEVTEEQVSEDEKKDETPLALPNESQSSKKKKKNK